MSIIPRDLRVIDDPPPTRELKLKGRKLYRAGGLFAEIRGCREWVRCEPHGNYQVWRSGEMVASGFCYFADAVKWARAASLRGE